MEAGAIHPGFYVDTDTGSERTQISGEYAEPQVSFGVAPGGASASLQAGTVYRIWSRVTAGRGDRSLMKFRTYATGLNMPGVGISGYYLCAEYPENKILEFPEGYYAPNCIIRDRITGTITSCTNPPPLPAAPSCTTGLVNGGGSNGIDSVKDSGNTAGVVQVQLETYGVPDRLLVTQESDGKRLLDTGFVSGYHTYTFNYIPTSKLTRVVVEGNKVQTTQWQVRMSCPGKGIEDSIPRRKVYFSVQNNRCNADWRINVNGIGWKGLLAGIDLSVGTQHLVEASYTVPSTYQLTCSAGLNNSPGTLYVNDGKGAVPVIQWSGPYQALFDVRP